MTHQELRGYLEQIETSRGIGHDGQPTIEVDYMSRSSREGD